MRDSHDILKEIERRTNPELRDEDFPDAPMEWTRDSAAEIANADGVEMGDDHWEAVRVLQAVYAEDEKPPMRRLHDALVARFGEKGGNKYLFLLFPGGPLAQGCRIAGLVPPAGSVDKSFGAVR
jgi:tRNA 2-thiouridine synthesizing protein E